MYTTLLKIRLLYAYYSFKLLSARIFSTLHGPLKYNHRPIETPINYHDCVSILLQIIICLMCIAYSDAPDICSVVPVLIAAAVLYTHTQDLQLIVLLRLTLALNKLRGEVWVKPEQVIHKVLSNLHHRSPVVNKPD